MNNRSRLPIFLVTLAVLGTAYFSARKWPDVEFWAATAAIGTMVAALVALFREEIRTLLFNPRLQVTLYSTAGSFSTFSDGSKGRFFHVRVASDFREFPFREVGAYLRELRMRAADGEYVTAWSGRIPLQWSSEETFFEKKNIGPEMLADIIHIRSDGQIGIKAWIIPNELAARFAALNAKKDFHLQFLVQAQSLEQDSVDLKIGFDWNGIWVDGDAEITNHVRIREIAPPSPVTGYSP